MDRMIQEIIAFDYQCNQDVEDAQKDKETIIAHLNDNKKEIYDSFAKEFENKLNENKQQLQTKMNETKKKNNLEYEASMHSLEELYESHKEEWIHTIVERCKEI